MNDMMEIKIDGQIASGQISGDFETLLKDTRKILTTIYYAIKKETRKMQKNIWPPGVAWYICILQRLKPTKWKNSMETSQKFQPKKLQKGQ